MDGWVHRETGVESTLGEPSCGSRCVESGSRVLENGSSGRSGRREGAAGTDATSGSLQKAGLQQGWMLTKLSGALSRDSLQGCFLSTLSRDFFQRWFPELLSKDSFQGH